MLIWFSWIHISDPDRPYLTLSHLQRNHRLGEHNNWHARSANFHADLSTHGSCHRRIWDCVRCIWQTSNALRVWAFLLVAAQPLVSSLLSVPFLVCAPWLSHDTRLVTGVRRWWLLSIYWPRCAFIITPMRAFAVHWHNLALFNGFHSFGCQCI